MTIWICTSCGLQNVGDRCPCGAAYCGSLPTINVGFAWMCTNCGATNPGTNFVCGTCGKPVQGITADMPSVPQNSIGDIQIAELQKQVAAFAAQVQALEERIKTLDANIETLRQAISRR